MAKEHIEDLPRIHVPSASLHGSRSRFVNLYTPAVSRTILPEEIVPSKSVALSTSHGTTPGITKHLQMRGFHAGFRCRTVQLLESFSTGKILDLGQRLTYDARWVSSNNIAHLLQYHAAALGMFKVRLGIEPADCTVVLEKNASSLAHRLIRLLGFEVVETHRPVRATLLTVHQDDPHTPYHLLPFASCLMPSCIRAPGISKIYIPRRDSRCILNQAEIDSVARDHGFEKIYLEDFTLEEQLGLTCFADEILAIHGAALGYLCMRSPSLNSPTLLLTEILSPGLVVDVYRKYIAVLGGRWRGCRGTIDSSFMRIVEETSRYKSAAFRNFHLDAVALSACLTEKIEFST